MVSIKRERMNGRNTFIWVAVPLLILLAACISGEKSMDMPEVEKPHYYYDLVVHEGYLYATSPWGLEVFSVERESLSRVGGFETPGEAQALALSKDRLYLSDTTGMLYVFDLGTPLPRVVAELELNKTAQKIVISGDRAYLACVSSGLVILDLPELEEVEIYKPRTYSYPKGIYVQDGRLYVADLTMGLYIAEVKDDSLVLSASHPTTSVPHDVLVFNGFAYVAGSDGGVDVFKISGNQIEKIQNLPLPGFALHLTRHENYLLVTLAGEGVALLEIQKDGRLGQVAQYNTPGNAYGIAIANGYAYVADYDGGIVVFDLSRLPELVPVAVAGQEVDS